MLEKWKNLPVYNEESVRVKDDWLITAISKPARLYRGENQIIILTNGLIRRTFTIQPNGATIGYDNIYLGESLLRGIKPEAKIKLNGIEYEIGGLKGQVEYAYLLAEWIPSFKSDINSFQLNNFYTQAIQKRMEWKKVRHCENREWPPKGIELIMEYVRPESKQTELDGIIIEVHYECYEGIPLFSKWIGIRNESNQTIHLDGYTNEILALVEYQNVSAGGMKTNGTRYGYPHIYFEHDYSFCSMDADNGNKVTHWTIDEQFSSQVAYLSDSVNLMQSYLEIGPDVDIEPNSKFIGFREFQLVDSSYDRQRKGLARCQMYRTIAPWITENPLMMHLTNMSPNVVKEAISQMKEVGFEMLIFSFGSNFSTNVLELGIDHPDWVNEMFEEIQEDVISPIQNAGIEVGGYSLLASRKISNEDDVVNPFTGKTSDISSPQLEDGIEAIQGVDSSVSEIQGAPVFGNSPCLGSKWGLRYFESMRNAFEKLNLNILEHDGSYPGDVCASKSHPGHKGLNDSQWKQWKIITEFYNWCRGNGIFLNVPDWYILSGSNKTGIGYKEVNWSLPRDRQVMLGRQNIYDGTWEKTPTMGWTFCPLTTYHSVPEYPPEVATLEPLSEHLNFYEAHLAQNLGSGVQACYRGFRLFDTEETKNLVKKYIDWYKEYRDILESDIVHIRRPDGRNIDGILHVNPRLSIKGFAMLYNPTPESRTEIVKVPLYYTGLTDTTTIKVEGKDPKTVRINRDFSVEIMIKILGNYHTWITFE